MAIATIIEKYQGTQFVSENIYGVWWFSALWAVLTAFAIVYFLKRKVRRWSTIALHLSFVLILAGALLTHLTASQGTLHLRQGEETKDKALPFSIRLDKFNINYHEGTMAASNYVSQFTVIDNDSEVKGETSMNSIFSHRGIRLYQSGYDPDERGAYLSYNSDPWGIPVTYTAYGLLFLSLVWILLDPKGRFRQILREASRNNGMTKPRNNGTPTSRKTALMIAALMLSTGSASAQRTLPRETAEDFGRLYVVYNNRVSPLQTFALDFTKKLCGKRSYNGFSAEQVLAGFIFFPEDWNKEPLLKIKGGAMKDRLQLPDMCSVATFFNPEMGGYILGPYLREAYNGNNDAFHKDVMKMDDRLMLIMELRQGKPLTLFPYKSGAPWLSPTDKLPEEMTAENKTFIQNVFNLLFEDALSGDWQHFSNIVAGMKKYQEKYGASSLPTATQTKAERLYNSVPFATILFMVCLTMAFLSVIRRRWMQWISIGILALSFAALTLCMALRWIISGTIPMANGYETMLLMAWMIQLMALFLHRRFPIIITFGLLMSGFFLLVSHISQMDPKISHVMPVLSSPLLSLHVSIIMMAFALLSLTFIIGIFSLVMPKNTELSTQNYKLSILFLFPAMTCLGFGIFIGAIWANISWGTYWSWDPKEVWALITFMIYGIALHDKSLPWLRNPKHYHLFMVLAFLTILMTYFGVNYFLGGMHSYA